MRIAMIALFSVVVFGTGCEEKTSVTIEQTLSHPNGLVVGVPTGFAATETSAGYRLVETADVRSPRQITLSFASIAESTSNLNRTRELPGAETPVRFSVEELGAGSGGTEYELIAAKSVGKGFVTAKAVEQSERGEPSFEIAWWLLEVTHRPE